MSSGTRLAVWAPLAAEVVAVLGEPDGAGQGQRREPMRREADGWWYGSDLQPGSDYGFLVDGEGPFPDPRSPWQPHGVHGLSRDFDASAYAWRDGGWQGKDARGAVIYELHVGTATAEGTLDAIDDGVLAGLVAAGIDMIELMPVAAFPGTRGWGYDGVALYSVHDAYGGPAALQRLVDRAHRYGLAVCLDVVYNHLGPDGNYLARFGPYFTDAHHTPWGWAVNLDQDGCEGMRAFIIDNALRWFRDFHVDALRLDAIHELHDDSPRHLLAELSERTSALSDELGRPLSLIAESDRNDPTTVAPVAQGGLGMTAQWADDVHHALHAYLTGERHGYYVDFGDVDTLDHALRHVFVHDGGFSTFRGQPWGAPVADDADRRRFVVFASNHDQIGNRALGDRPSARLSQGAQAASLAIVLLGPFTPLLFMGEQWGDTTPFLYFTDHDEPLGSAVSAGRLAEFASHGWEHVYGGPVPVPDPQARDTYARSRVLLHSADASMPAAQAAMLEWHHQVMRLRPQTVADEAWRRFPVSACELAPRQLVVTGPVQVHANLSPTPMPLPAAPASTFGLVHEEDGAWLLMPDGVALLRGDDTP